MNTALAVDLFFRQRRLSFNRPEVTPKEKYRTIAVGIRQILAAWGDVPPQFARFYVPEHVYDKLLRLYLKANDPATRLE